MTEFKGLLRLVGDATSLPAAVQVGAGEIRIRSSGTELGSWPLSEVLMEERPDGFLLTVEDGQLLVTPFDRSGFSDAVSAGKDAVEQAARTRRRRRSRSGGRRRAATDGKSSGEQPRKSASDEATRKWWRRTRRPPTEDGPSGRTTATSSPVVREADTAAPRAGQRGLGRFAARIVERLAGSTRRGRIVGGVVLAAFALAVFAARVLTILVLVGGGLVVLLGILAYVDDYVAVRIPAPWTPLRVIGLGLGVLVVGALIPLLLL